MKKFLLSIAIIAAAGLGYVAFDTLRREKIDLEEAEFKSPDNELGVVRVRRNDKWILTSGGGRVVSEAEYDAMDPFYDGKAVILKDGKYGAIDSRGRVIVEPKYDYIMGYDNGVATVGLSGKWGLIDAKGQEILKPDYYDYISPFDPSGNARATNYGANGRDEIIDRAGKVVKTIKQ
jgi:hypothetical protein